MPASASPRSITTRGTERGKCRPRSTFSARGAATRWLFSNRKGRRRYAELAWPNGMEGGRVHGCDEIRAYWRRQWGILDPTLSPRASKTMRRQYWGGCPPDHLRFIWKDPQRPDGTACVFLPGRLDRTHGHPFHVTLMATLTARISICSSVLLICGISEAKSKGFFSIRGGPSFGWVLHLGLLNWRVGA